jgi:hypothetical protein
MMAAKSQGKIGNQTHSKIITNHLSSQLESTANPQSSG